MDILIKADDLVFAERQKMWGGFLESCLERNLPVSVGVIGQESERNFNRGRVNRISDLLASPLVSLWNHGYVHHIKKFKGQPLEYQVEQITRAREAIRTTFGADTDVFGAPFNQHDDQTMLACRAANCRAAFGSGQVEGLQIIGLENLFAFETDKFETPTRKVVNPQKVRFEQRYKMAKEADGLVIMQLHPRRWNRQGVVRFGGMLDFLLGEGCRFVSLGDCLDS